MSVLQRYLFRQLLAGIGLVTLALVLLFQYTKIINVHPPYRPSYELAITFEKPFDEVALCCALCEDLFVDIEKVGEEVLAKHFFRLIKKSMPKYADALYSVEINNYNG